MSNEGKELNFQINLSFDVIRWAPGLVFTMSLVRRQPEGGELLPSILWGIFLPPSHNYIEDKAKAGDKKARLSCI